jgi:hypothetical protein
MKAHLHYTVDFLTGELLGLTQNLDITIIYHQRFLADRVDPSLKCEDTMRSMKIVWRADADEVNAIMIAGVA